MKENREWYYYEAGEKKGPIKEAALVWRLKDRELSWTTKVSCPALGLENEVAEIAYEQMETMAIKPGTTIIDPPPVDKSKREWYYYEAGKRKGPISEAALVWKLKDRELSWLTKVSCPALGLENEVAEIAYEQMETMVYPSEGTVVGPPLPPPTGTPTGTPTDTTTTHKMLFSILAIVILTASVSIYFYISRGDKCADTFERISADAKVLKDWDTFAELGRFYNKKDCSDFTEQVIGLGRSLFAEISTALFTEEQYTASKPLLIVLADSDNLDAVRIIRDESIKKENYKAYNKYMELSEKIAKSYYTKEKQEIDKGAPFEGLHTWQKFLVNFPEVESEILEEVGVCIRQLKGERYTDAVFFEIRTILEKAAEANIVDAMVMLSDQLQKLNPVTSFYWLEQAANNGHAIAMVRVGQREYTGQNTDRTPDFIAAGEWFESAMKCTGSEAVNARIEAKCYLATLIKRGEFSIPGKTLKEAEIKLLKSLIDEELISNNTLSDKAINYDDSITIKAYTDGAFELSRYYYAGIDGVLKKDEKEAVRLAKIAANKKNPKGMGLLGQYYFEGIGRLEQNNKKGIDLLLKAAEKNVKFAIHSLIAYFESVNDTYHVKIWKERLSKRNK